MSTQYPSDREESSSEISRLRRENEELRELLKKATEKEQGLVARIKHLENLAADNHFEHQADPESSLWGV